MTDLPDVAIHIERCRAEASLPFYAHPGDAGMDLRAAENCVIEPGQTVAVPTGLRLAIPAGFEIQIRPRSGLSLHTPLRVPNSPGTIDSGFPGRGLRPLVKQRADRIGKRRRAVDTGYKGK